VYLRHFGDQGPEGAGSEQAMQGRKLEFTTEKAPSLQSPSAQGFNQGTPKMGEYNNACKPA